ncbi:MAG TPA: DNA methyltransferase, partial [Candidatus Limnocylindrales bacterium]
MTSDRAARPLPVQQGAVELPSVLPRLSIAPEWKDQQRLWGHSFHPMCSYLASFPAALAHAFIARYSRSGDVVLDPFSGRGTVPLQALAEGRVGVGNDLNPFAHLLTAAKVEPPSIADVLTRLAGLRLAWAAEDRDWRDLADTILDRTAHRPAQASAQAARPTVPPAGSTLRPADVSNDDRAPGERVPVEVCLAFHPSTLAELLYVRSVLDLGVP